MHTNRGIQAQDSSTIPGRQSREASLEVGAKGWKPIPLISLEQLEHLAIELPAVEILVVDVLAAAVEDAKLAG